MDILSLVGCGGAGSKFARYVSERTGVRATVINDSGGDINLDGNKAEAYVSVGANILSSTFPWLKRIGSQNTFVLAGLGGVLGTSVVRLIANSKRNIDLYGIFTLPFKTENEGRRKRAMEAMKDIERGFTGYIILDNDGLIRHYSNIPIPVAMEIPAEVMRHIVLDFRNMVIKNAMNLRLAGRMGVGIGFGVGKERIRVAIEDALDSPWITDGRKVMLFSGDLDAEEVKYVVRDYDVDFYDVYRTPEYGEEVKVTVLTVD